MLSTLVFIIISNNHEFRWYQLYSGQSNYVISDIIEAKDGNFIVIGTKMHGSSAAKIWLMKVNTDGHPLWNKSLSNSPAEGHSIAECSDGGFIIAGEFFNESLWRWQILLLRISEDGTVLWSKNLLNKIQDERPYDILRSSDGGFAITGSRDKDSYYRDCLVTKIDSFGNKLWDYSFGGYSTDVAYSIVETAVEEFVVAGRTRFLSGMGNTNMYLAKLNASGLIWEKAFGGSLYTKAYDLLKTSDGGLVLVGCSRESYEDDNHFTVVRVDNEGETKWSKVYDYKGIGFCIIQPNDENLVIVGETRSMQRILVLKTDMNGSVVAHQQYGREEYTERVTSIIQASTEDLIMVGYSEIGGDWEPRIVEAWFHKIII